MIKSDSKDTYDVTKDFYFQINAVLLNFLFKESWKKKIYHCFHKRYLAEQLFLLLIIRNVSWAENQHIRMISEGSCDTGDWSNDSPSQE